MAKKFVMPDRRIKPTPNPDNRERYLKTGWHLLLVGVAVVEWRTAETKLRKNLLAGCAGWHLSCAVVDWLAG